MYGWVDGWRHWLTKYTSKESTFRNTATFHTTIPTQVAVTYHYYLCRDGCVKCMLMVV